LGPEASDELLARQGHAISNTDNEEEEKKKKKKKKQEQEEVADGKYIQ
jgi:hypothetical protein